MLRNQGHFVVYFDAWENDYSADPFVGFMSAINAQLKASLPTKGKISLQAQAMTRAGSRVIKTAAPSIAFAVIKNFTGVDVKSDILNHVDKATKSAGKEIASTIKADLEKQNKDLKNAIGDFKKSFSSFAQIYEKEHPTKLPIFLMVDELDRCRPSYAIELLEKIKHIFRVDNVYTVVATDSQQLAHSIKAVYGSEFDSRKYLRRFFDHESRLDTPQFAQLAAAMLEQRKLADDPKIDNVIQRPGGLPTSSEVLAKIGQAMKVTTRDFMRSIDILDTIRITQSDQIDLIAMTFLIMLYVSHVDLFDAYTRTLSASSIVKNTTVHFDTSITWNEIGERSDGFGGQIEIQVPAIEWVLDYMTGVWSDRPLETDHSWVILRNAIRKLGMGSASNTSQSSLQKYHRVVSMAGHFSI